MNKMLLLGGALAASLSLSLPGAASAQSSPDRYDLGAQNAGARPGDASAFFSALRSVDLRDDQRRRVRDIERDSNGDRQAASRQILGVLDDGQRRQLFATLRGDGGDARGYQQRQDGGGYGQRDDGAGYRQGGDARGVSGVVGSFDQYDLRLRDGARVRLHQGTVIEPTGTTIRSGERVSIRGRYDGNGTLEADRIVVDSRGYGREDGRGY